jgi:hypothetical protein
LFANVCFPWNCVKQYPAEILYWLSGNGYIIS